MIARRAIGISMIAIEVALTQLTMGYWVVSGTILCIALLGCWPRVQFVWSSRSRLMSVGALVLAFYLLLRLDIIGKDPFRAEPLEMAAPLVGALCAMSIQALVCFWRSPQGLPGYFPALGIIALAFAADHFLEGPFLAKAWMYSMLFGLLMLLFYAVDPSQRREGVASFRVYRYTLLALCSLLAFALASGTAFTLKRSDRVVAQWMANRELLQRVGLGNSPQSRLDSMSDIKTRDYDRIALQIESSQPPGYLRGQAYADYENQTWSALTPGATALATEALPDGYQKLWRSESLYRVLPEAKAIDRSMTVFPDSSIDRAIFAPHKTGWIGRSSDGLIINDAGVVQSSRSLNSEPYQVLTMTESAPLPLSEEERVRYTVVPEKLASRLRGLSAIICGEKSTTKARASAIAQYFAGNYDYLLGIQIPRGADPMEYFLFSDPLPAAHCEFFATGAALLLRASGIPARYVTGVGVWEQHPFADYWVARNRDAHAWVEAWDPEEGWFIVEATPASGLPEAGVGQSTSTLGDLWNLLKLNIQRLLAAFRDGAWHQAIVAIQSVVVGLYLFVQKAWWWLILILGAGMVLNRLRHRFRRRPAVELPADALARRLHSQLGVMDRLVRRRHRLVRANHITVHAFARAIEGEPSTHDDMSLLAQWYRAWAALRYQVQPDPVEIDALDTALAALRGRKR